MESDVESMEWIVPQIPEETEVTLTGSAQALVDFPITPVREADTGKHPRSFRFSTLTQGVIEVGDECTGGDSTDFDEFELEATCIFTFFEADGPYTIRADLADDCASETQGNPRPAISYEFTAGVVGGSIGGPQHNAMSPQCEP